MCKYSICSIHVCIEWYLVLLQGMRALVFTNCHLFCHVQVSLLAPPGGVMLAGLAVALILGGVANGIAPRLWQLEASHPILWLDALSYTR